MSVVMLEASDQDRPKQGLHRYPGARLVRSRLCRLLFHSLLNKQLYISVSGVVEVSRGAADIGFVNEILPFHVKQVDCHLTTKQSYISLAAKITRFLQRWLKGGYAQSSVPLPAIIAGFF